MIIVRHPKVVTLVYSHKLTKSLTKAFKGTKNYQFRLVKTYKEKFLTNIWKILKFKYKLGQSNFNMVLTKDYKEVRHQLA